MMEKKELENMKIDLKEIEKDIQQFLDYIYTFYCNNDELLSEVEYFVNMLEEKYHIQLTYL